MLTILQNTLETFLWASMGVVASPILHIATRKFRWRFIDPLYTAYAIHDASAELIILDMGSTVPGREWFVLELEMDYSRIGDGLFYAWKSKLVSIKEEERWGTG